MSKVAGYEDWLSRQVEKWEYEVHKAREQVDKYKLARKVYAAYGPCQTPVEKEFSDFMAGQSNV